MKKIFISYSQDSKEYKRKVLSFANKLRQFGLNVEIDQYENHPEHGWVPFMQTRIKDADVILCACTQKYKESFEFSTSNEIGKGVKTEARMIAQYIYQNKDIKEIIPIIIDENSSQDDIPILFGSFHYYNVNNQNDLRDLYARLSEQETNIKPPLGNIVSPTQFQILLNLELNEKKEINVKEESILRFIGNGIDRKTAEHMIEELNNSDNFDYILDKKYKYRFLIGEFGSGKSLALSVLFTKRLRYGDIAFLIKAVDFLHDFCEQKNIPEIYKESEKDVWVFIDGLDELNYEDAIKIINNVRYISDTYQNIYFIMSSRPIYFISEYYKENIIQIKKLREDEVNSILEQVSGRKQNVFFMDQSIRQTLANPFFAVLFGVYCKDKYDVVGISKIKLIKYLVEKSLILNKLGVSVKDKLIELAIKYIDSGMNKILISELPPSCCIDNLVDFGIVQIQNGYVYFPLPIIAQWLAAEAIHKKIVSYEKILYSVKTVENWRYAIMIFFASRSFEVSYELFSNLVCRYPGVASQIIKDNIELDTIETLCDAQECAEKLYNCYVAWKKGLGDLSKHIMHIDDDNLCTFYIHTTKSEIALFWHPEYDGKKYIVCAPDNMYNMDLSFWQTTVPKTQIWPWILSFQDISRRLGRFIQSKPIILENKLLLNEAVYYYLVSCNRNKMFDDIDTLDIIIDESYPNPIIDKIKELKASGIKSIKYPYIKPDFPRRTGYYYSKYDFQTLAKYLIDIYKKAMDTYEKVCDSIFVSLKPFMYHRLLMPATMHIEYIQHIYSPYIKYFMTCNEYGSENSIDFKSSIPHDSADEKGVDPFKAIQDSILRYRFDINYSIPLSHKSEILLDVLGEYPLRSIIYNWIEEDLKKIGWL